jgi:hypothetical protein
MTIPHPTYRPVLFCECACPACHAFETFAKETVLVISQTTTNSFLTQTTMSDMQLIRPSKPSTPRDQVTTPNTITVKLGQLISQLQTNYTIMFGAKMPKLTDLEGLIQLLSETHVRQLHSELNAIYLKDCACIMIMPTQQKASKEDFQTSKRQLDALYSKYFETIKKDYNQRKTMIATQLQTAAYQYK